MQNAYVREGSEDGQRTLVVQVTRSEPSSIHAVCPDVRIEIDTPHRFVYLDVGAWIGDSTTERKRNFGVIYGNGREGWVVLCERPPEHDYRPVNRMPGDFREVDPEVTNTLLAFIRHCHSHIVGHVARDRMLNTNGEIYVFLGDLHLPLIMGTTPPSLIERVERKWMNLSRPYRHYQWAEDLEDYLFFNPISVHGAISTIRGRGALDAPESSSQWKDCYTNGDIFSPRGSGTEAANDLNNFIGELESWQRTPVHLSQLGDMFEFWIGLQSLFTAGRLDVPSSNHDEIRNWLSFAYHSTIVGDRSLADRIHQCTVSQKTWIYGNHDNYLHCVPGNEVTFTEVEQRTEPYESTRRTRISQQHRWASPPPRHQDYFVHQNGIRMEHGHQGDEFNRDNNAIRGHDITQACFTLGPWTRVFGDQGRAKFIAYGASRYFTRWDERDIKVFVMAHTHEPHLERVNVYRTDRRIYEPDVGRDGSETRRQMPEHTFPY
jgi:UDP-2,3-diacylglucosamine pyrophosphatase LpxH